MMKKWIRHLAVLLAIAMIAAGICGCGSDSTASFSGDSASDVIAEAVSEMEDAAALAEDTEAEVSQDPALSESEEVVSEDPASEEAAAVAEGEDEEEVPDEDGTYDSKEEVAAYLHAYGKLPSNYITKKEAQNLGWSGGSVEQYAEGKCIGGTYYGNYEGILPEGSYHECDIDTLGKSSRGAKRIVYSDDGNIYYTEDHYETFTLLYTADGPSDGSVVYK